MENEAFERRGRKRTGGKEVEKVVLRKREEEKGKGRGRKGVRQG